MKKCLRCNKEFEDDSLYCPECGKQLENNENFCSQCGNKVTDAGYIVNKGYKKFKQSLAMERDYNKVVTILLSVVATLVALLLIVGMFGDIVSVKVLENRGSESIKYFFGEGAQNIKDIKNAYPYKEYYGMVLTEFVLLNIFYFGGLVGLFISIGLTIASAYKTFKNQAAFKITPILGMIVSVIPYISYVAITSIAKASEYFAVGTITFGWGPIMLIVGSLFGLVSISCIEAYASKDNRRETITNLLFNLSAILAMTIIFFATSLIISITDGSTTAEIGAPVFIRIMLQPFSAGETNSLPSQFSGFVASYVLMALSVFTSILFIVFTFKKSKKLSLLLGITSIVIYLTSSIIQLVSANHYLNGTTTNVGVGGGAIASYILLVFLAVTLVGSFILSNKKKQA